MDKMSPQVKQLKAIVDAAKMKDVASIIMLRSICISMAGSETMPLHELVNMGEFFVDMGIRAREEQLSQN